MCALYLAGFSGRRCDRLSSFPALVGHLMESSVRRQPGAKRLLFSARVPRPCRAPRHIRCEWATALASIPLRSTSGLPVGPQCQNARQTVRDVSSSAVSVPDDLQSPVGRAEQSRAELDETFETSQGVVGPVEESEAEVRLLQQSIACGQHHAPHALTSCLSCMTSVCFHHKHKSASKCRPRHFPNPLEHIGPA